MQTFIYCTVTLHVTRWKEVAVPVSWLIPEVADTVFSTPDDGCCDARNMWSDCAVNKYLHTVASSWTFLLTLYLFIYLFICVKNKEKNSCKRGIIIFKKNLFLNTNFYLFALQYRIPLFFISVPIAPSLRHIFASTNLIYCKTRSPVSFYWGHAAGDAVGWGTALQAGRSRFRLPDGVIGIFHWHNPSGRTMALGSTQPLTEMSTRNVSWEVKAAGA